MKTNTLEKQLQDINVPTPDPAARLQARRAAMAEFRRVHAIEERKPARSRWSWRSPWMGGLATACVAIVGISVAWLVPPEERRLQSPRVAAVPVPTATPAAGLTAAPAVAAPAAATPISEAQSAPRERKQPAVAAAAPSAARLAEPRADAASAPAAQKSEDGILGEVQVTGSRIQAPGATSANPIANLRGLDPAFGGRTLTLVDGRREVSTSNQADVVDLNTIPPNLLSRIDVVTGGASASYPVATPPAGGDKFEHFETNSVKRVADEPVSTFSIDVDTASYSFVRQRLNQAGTRQGVGLPPMDAVRVEEMINYFDYAWPAPTSRTEPLRSTVTVSDSPWGKGRKLVHIGIKGYELPARSKPDANIVFLLDVSGSMSPQDRLPLAVQSLRLLLDSLKPTDTVAIVVYAGAAGIVLPPTPVRDRQTIERALNSLHAGGSTAGGQGIQLAYNVAQQNFRKDGVNRILLTTDGDFNVGMRSTNELKELVERERTRGVYLSVLTFGQGNNRDEVAQTLAQNGNGVAAYIDTLQEARKVLVQEASSSLFTIASDVKIQVEFNPATVAEYRLVGYETRALKREDFNNDKVDAGDVGSGHRVTAIYEITPVGSGAQLIDESRYGDSAKGAADAQSKSKEYGFVKIRYKLPGESTSRLMQQPIRQDAGVPAALRQDVNFSTAVAGFAQLLRGGKYTGALGYDDVIRQAEASLGKDEYGYRAEFVQLARKARDIGTPSCANSPAIQQINARINAYQQQVSQLVPNLGEQHPDVLAAKARLAGAEADRAAEVARLARQGVTCPAEPVF